MSYMLWATCTESMPSTTCYEQHAMSTVLWEHAMNNMPWTTCYMNNMLWKTCGELATLHRGWSWERPPECKWQRWLYRGQIYSRSTQKQNWETAKRRQRELSGIKHAQVRRPSSGSRRQEKQTFIEKKQWRTRGGRQGRARDRRMRRRSHLSNAIINK